MKKCSVCKETNPLSPKERFTASWIISALQTAPKNGKPQIQAVKGFFVAQTKQISKHFLEDLERQTSLNHETASVEY